MEDHAVHAHRTNRDPKPSVLNERGYVRLPQMLEEALGRFDSNPVVTGWFPQGFADVYVKHKEGELDS